MKKIISFIIVLCMIFTGFSTNVHATSVDMQAVWITTVFGADWPKTKTSQSQQQEMIELLDDLKSVGIDTVMFQVRTQGDALYKSNINPWSSVLTGTQGKNPGYDPLEFVIKEAHKRNMKVHAWLNPYRVTTSGTDLNLLSSQHQAKKNPKWVIKHDGRMYFNPELTQVKQHIVDTVAEIVNNYNVDGIHLDDYFYPSKYPLPSNDSNKDGNTANIRRNHITDMVTKVRAKIKSIDSSVDFGISPSGIWKNKINDENGSNTKGNESYYSDYADTRSWVKNQIVDYIVPQIYWETGHSAADYETLVKWWSDVAKGTNVDLYIGQGIYKDVVASQIDEQLKINMNYSQVDGSVYYTSRDIISNRQGCRDKIKTFIENNKTQANRITDIEGHWAYDEIRSFINKGYIDGYEDNTFRPNTSITRGEFVKILNKSFGLTTMSGKVFSDTVNHWAKEEIDIAVTNGVCNGKTETEFKPNDYITREEVAVMISNYKRLSDSNLDKLNTYNDASKVSSWAKPSVEGNLEKKYLGGYGDNTIRPRNKITRAEAVVTLSRVK